MLFIAPTHISWGGTTWPPKTTYYAPCPLWLRSQAALSFCALCLFYTKNIFKGRVKNKSLIESYDLNLKYAIGSITEQIFIKLMFIILLIIISHNFNFWYATALFRLVKSMQKRA